MKTAHLLSSLLGAGLVALSFGESPAFAQAAFTFDPPGKLTSGSGSGRMDDKIYAPAIRFPMEKSPAFANSQVWGVGGSAGPTGAQSDRRNFSYPWHDNYCETRTYSMPLCPAGQGHQGQDIRGATAEKLKHWNVAVADGTITNIGSYSVYLTTADGTRFDYLHMGNLQVKVGQKVTRGQRIGMVSNEFGGTPTTVHMHFNIRQNVAGVGLVYVPPYTSLVSSYQTLLASEMPDAGAPDAGPEEPPKPDAAAPRPLEKDAGSDDGEESLAPPPELDDGCAVSPSSASGAGSAAQSIGGWLSTLVVAAFLMNRHRRRARR